MVHHVRVDYSAMRTHSDAAGGTLAHPPVIVVNAFLR